MFAPLLFFAFVSVRGAAIVDDARNPKKIQDFQELGASPDVISAGQPPHEFLELHQGKPEGLAASIKEKRCKTNGYAYDLVGSSRSSLPTLHLTRRDLQSESLKKRCEMCREGARCKKLGKCDLCTQICERYEAAMRVLDVQERDVTSKFGETLGRGLSEQEDRYYTVGAFAPGLVFDFITRLLGLHTKNTIERFIVLAKAKTKGSKAEPSHPVVIDTAHIFSINEGRPKELDFEVHEVTNQAKGDIDALTSQLNSELDKAMDAKKKTQSDPYLTPDEIDRVIEETVGSVSDPKFASSPVVGMSSRIGDDEAISSPKPEDSIAEKESEEVSSEAAETPPATSSRNGDESTDDEPVSFQGVENSSEEAETPSPIVGMSSRNNFEDPTPENEGGASEDATTMSSSSSSSSPAAPPIEEEASTGHEVDTDQDAPEETTDSRSEESAESEEKRDQNRASPRANEEPQNFEAPQTRNGEFQEVIPQENFYHEPPLPYSDNQYGPPSKPSYQYSPKAYAPNTMAAPSEEPAPNFPEENFYPSDGPPSKPSYQYSPETYEEPAPNFPEEDYNRIYVPEGVVGAPQAFDEQYKDLKDWAGASAPPDAAPDAAHQNPRVPDGLLNRVNDIIDGAASSAKTLNEKIAHLVKTKTDELGPAAQDQIVRLNNMREFVTSFSPDQRSQIMDKEDEEEVKTAPVLKDPYDKHPRIESRYRNGEWTSEKLPPNRPPYHTRFLGGRTSEIVGTSNEEPNRRPYIDPKLLHMQSLIDDLKRVPDYVIQRAGEVAQAFRPKMEPTQEMNQRAGEAFRPKMEPTQEMNQRAGEAFRPKMEPTQEMNDPPGVTLLSRSGGNNETDEGVACSHEDSDEYREATKEEEEEQSNLSLAQTREAAEVEVISKDEGAPKDDGEEVKESDGQNETVACSKEEDEDDYDLVHVKPIKSYGDGYRSSLKEELSKLHLPTIDELIHPKAKAEHHHPRKSETQRMIEDLNRMHKHGHAAHHVEDAEEAFNGDAAPMMPNEFGFNPHYPPAMDESPPLPPPPQWQANAEEENDEVIGSPLLESRFQQQGENFTGHLGKLVPAESHLHHRDVSDQIKPVYFMGDGIKLPLHMKQHGDGSLHLSVDVKKLCKCKHCSRKQEGNDAERPKQGGGEDLGSIKDEDVALMMAAPGNLLEQTKPEFFDGEEHDKTEITKRSPVERNSLRRGIGSGELEAVFGEDASNEIFDDVTPIKRSRSNVVKRKVGLVTDVLDWMKKVALDEAKLPK